MRLFKRKKEPKSIKPGEFRKFTLQIPEDAETIVIQIDYADDFKNEYVTDITLDVKNKKVINQEYRCVKKVKDFGDNIPKLVIDEKSIDWEKIDKN